MGGDRKIGGILLRLWPAVAAAGVAVAVLGILANLAQIDALLLSGPQAIARVLALFAIFLCGCLLAQQKFRRNKMVAITCCVAILMSVGTMAIFWPQSPPASPESRHSDQGSVEPRQTTPYPTSQAPVRTLDQWAADINKICAQEATRVGTAFEQIRSAGGKIIDLSKQYEINTPLDVAQNADTLEPPMQQAFSAAAVVDSSYTTAYRQMASVDWPAEPSEKAVAEKWVDRYEQLGNSFHTVYETLANYTVNENEYLRATFFTKFALIDQPAYLKLTPEVLDEGGELGIRSCL